MQAPDSMQDIEKKRETSIAYESLRFGKYHWRAFEANTLNGKNPTTNPTTEYTHNIIYHLLNGCQECHDFLIGKGGKEMYNLHLLRKGSS